MMLVEEGQVPEAALPVDALKAHLRLGTGFDEESVQDGMLGSFLRAAMAAVEARTSKALITRGFVLTLNDLRDACSLALPLAPVDSVTEVTLVDAYGVASTIDPALYRLQRDSQTPRLLPRGSVLTRPPVNSVVEVRFRAGYGAAFTDLPGDLAQAIMLLAAHYYEYRDETSLGEGCMPFGVASLVARYRPLRLGAAG